MYASKAVVHVVYMAQGKRGRPAPKPKHRPTFIRQWREARELTLEELAERIGTTHATLSRVERGLIPYGQEMLEMIAEELGTDVASLIMRNPTDPDGIWSIWEKARPGERKMIVDIAKTVVKTGT